MENNETEMETARREILEETGLNPDFLPGFKAEDEYDLAEKPGTRKRVTYFLAEYKNQPLVPQQGEIRRNSAASLRWRPSCFEDEGTKSVLIETQTFLAELIQKTSDAKSYPEIIPCKPYVLGVSSEALFSYPKMEAPGAGVPLIMHT